MLVNALQTFNDTAHHQVLEHLLALLLLTLRECVVHVYAHVVDVYERVVEELDDLGAHGFHALLHDCVRFD